MKYALVVLVNDDLSQVYLLPKGEFIPEKLARFRQAMQEIVAKKLDGIRSIRTAWCHVPEIDNIEAAIQDTQANIEG